MDVFFRHYSLTGLLQRCLRVMLCNSDLSHIGFAHD